MQMLPFADQFGVPLDWIYRGIIAAVPYDLAQRILESQAPAADAVLGDGGQPADG